MRISLPVLVTLMSLPITAGGQTTKTGASESDLKNAAHELEAAEQKGDVNVMKNMIAEDCLLIGPRGNVENTAAPMISERSDPNKVIHSDEVFKVTGDVGLVTDTIKIKSESGEENYRVLTVWKFTNNQWRVIANSVVPLDSSNK
jgi:ketosteroid isomerase-like protein